MRLRAGRRDFFGAGFEPLKPVRDVAGQVCTATLEPCESVPALGRHFDDVRNHSSSSGVGGTDVVVSSDSISSTPASPFSGCTKWILKHNGSRTLSAARASSRSRRRDTLRVNVALLLRLLQSGERALPSRGCVSRSTGEPSAVSRMPTAAYPEEGPDLPNPILQMV